MRVKDRGGMGKGPMERKHASVRKEKVVRKGVGRNYQMYELRKGDREEKVERMESQ